MFLRWPTVCFATNTFSKKVMPQMVNYFQRDSYKYVNEKNSMEGKELDSKSAQ